MAQQLGEQPDVAGQTIGLNLGLPRKLQQGGKFVVRPGTADPVYPGLELLAP